MILKCFIRMDIVEAAETNFGKFVPLHLLQFNGDQQLQSNFRGLIEQDYGKGIVKHDFGLCQACSHPITWKSQRRMKPSKTKTNKILKLLAKEKSGAVFGKYNNQVLQRYKQSCTQLVVRCHICQNLNRQDLISNETKQNLKDATFEEVYVAEKPENLTPSQKKRRKKKKRKAEEEIGCVLSPSSLLKTPSIGQSQELCIQPSQVNSAPQAKHPKLSAMPKKFHLPHSALPKCKSTRSIPSYKGQTPQTSLKKGPLGANTPSRGKKHTLNQKNLKQFLQQGQQDVKRASLTDFLSSL